MPDHLENLKQQLQAAHEERLAVERLTAALAASQESMRRLHEQMHQHEQCRQTLFEQSRLLFGVGEPAMPRYVDDDVPEQLARRFAPHYSKI